MSIFSYNLPNLREIETSLAKSRQLVQESMQLSQRCFSHKFSKECCSRCCIFQTYRCSLLTRASPLHKSTEFSGSISHGLCVESLNQSPVAKELESKGEILSHENARMTQMIDNLSLELELLRVKDKSKAGINKDKSRTNDRIDKLERKIEEVEGLYKASLRNALGSTAASSKFERIQKKMRKSNMRSERIMKKVDVAEKVIQEKNKNRDRHCEKCLG